MLLVSASRAANRISIGFATVFLWLFYSASPACAESPVAIKPLVVAVVQGESSEPYLEFTRALHDNILKRNIDLVVVDDPAKPVPDADLVISVGMKAATAVAASNAPVVLNVLIPKAGYEKLLHDFPARANSKTFSAIFLDQPVARQIRLITAILPGKRRIGVLFDSFPQDELVQLRQQVSKYGLTLHESKIGPVLPLHEALQEVLQDSEVLLALPDPCIIDLAVLAGVMGNDRRKMRDFAMRFIESAREDIPKMEAALESRDMAALGALGHYVRSPALMVGAMGFAHLCKAMEHSEDMEQTRNIVSQLRPLLERIKEYIDKNLA